MGAAAAKDNGADGHAVGRLPRRVHGGTLRRGRGEAAVGMGGGAVAAIKRYGKFIVMPLDGGGYLLFHLGMTGRLLFGGDIGKHTHAILTLDRGVLLFDDSRKFGSLQFSREFPARVARLGPEPLEVSLDDFRAALKRHKTRIKALLLNQRFLRGVGNIYADEALFRAGIHPTAIASRLRGDRARKLYDALREVLSEAIEAGGSSISDYVDADGRSGFFQFSHRVYQRTGQPCVSCGTIIRRMVITQRSSHFCPRCQRR